VQSGLVLLPKNLKLKSLGLLASRTFPVVCLRIVLDGHAEGDNYENSFQPDKVWVTSTNDYCPTDRTIEPDLLVSTVELVVLPKWLSAG
jgi:hypothetical protein